MTIFNISTLISSKKNMDVNVVFLLNIFYFIFKTPSNICTALVSDFMCVSKFLCFNMIKSNRYDQILKTHDYF